MIKLVIQILWILAISGIPTSRAQERLYIFVPGNKSAPQIEKNLAGKLNDIQLTVFGRVRDFKAKIQLEPPNAIISYAHVVESLSDYPISIVGTYEGKKYQNYVLLSVDKKVDLNNLADIRIGILDFMGRKAIKQFIAAMLSSGPKLKRVTKFEDLLPLLNLRMVDAILVLAREVELIQAESQLNLVVAKVEGSKVGLAVLGANKNKLAEKTITAIRNLNAESKKLLGVETWQE